MITEFILKAQGQLNILKNVKRSLRINPWRSQVSVVFREYNDQQIATSGHNLEKF